MDVSEFNRAVEAFLWKVTGLEVKMNRPCPEEDCPGQLIEESTTITPRDPGKARLVQIRIDWSCPACGREDRLEYAAESEARIPERVPGRDGMPPYPGEGDL